MLETWQDVAVAGLVTLAVGYLGFRGWWSLARQRSGGCGSGSCSRCDSASEASADQPRPFVPREQLTSVADSDNRAQRDR